MTLELGDHLTQNLNDHEKEVLTVLATHDTVNLRLRRNNENACVLLDRRKGKSTDNEKNSPIAAVTMHCSGLSTQHVVECLAIHS